MESSFLAWTKEQEAGHRRRSGHRQKRLSGARLREHSKRSLGGDRKTIVLLMEVISLCNYDVFCHVEMKYDLYTHSILQ
jgi:hypothetical protein